MKEFNYIIIGGGCSGLSLAYELEINKKLTIGIPKEVLLQEKRIGLVPDAVNLLTLNNHSVIVQSGVGQIINFTDILWKFTIWHHLSRGD